MLRNRPTHAVRDLVRLGVCAAALCVVSAAPKTATAQFGVGGVYVDADGVLRETRTLAPDRQLELLRAESAEGPSSRELAAASKLRKVSLARLERHVRKLHAQKQPLPADVRYLAGLSGLKYVFFYPETQDVVLAGPAESWEQLPTGEVAGTTSNRPALQLDDLLVGLRYAFDRQQSASFVGCSIDPTADGLRKHSAYMKSLGGRMDRSRVQQIFAGMEQAMGPQEIRVFGVPSDSRFAMKLVAADYRLKRIALGHDASPVREVVNYLDLAAQRLRGGAQPQHRWWFVARYDAVFHTPDNLGFELSGQGVEVTTARTLEANAGEDEKDNAKQASAPARQFATTFTKHFSEMAQRIPVFAELQNLIGLAVAAELISQTASENAASETGRPWTPTHFLDAKACPVESVPVPKQVPSISNYRHVRNRYWLISVSGGVEIQPAQLASREARREAPDGALSEARGESQPPNDAEPWWWD